jgi:hypothetical protein
VSISYSQPLTRAWERTRAALFRRPDWPKRWFVIGFAAFLSGRVGMSGTWQFEFDPWDGGPSAREFAGGLLTDPVLPWLAAELAVLGLALWVVLLWISSRGRFVFLDNVVRGHRHIAEPWRRHAIQGNSLFVWRLVFLLIAFGVSALLIGPPLVLGGAGTALTGGGLWAAGGVFVAVVFAVLIGIAAAYVRCFLDSFVIPIMYRDGLTTNDAWRRFLPLLRAHTAEFLLYGLLLFFLVLAVSVVVLVAGLLTCCIGWILIAIPYVGTVLLLPIWFTYRGYGPEFLAQFGPEWSVFPAAPPPEPPGGGPTAPPDSDADRWAGTGI